MFVHVITNSSAVRDRSLSVGRVWRSTRRLVRETACAITGHDYNVRGAANRMFLRCADCEHETPGWHIDVPDADRASRSDAPRYRPIAIRWSLP